MAIKETLLAAAVLIFLLWAAGAFHVIDQGHIGVYKRGGALLNSWTDPGLHFMIPFITTYHQVQITLQTDQVLDIPCGTSSGVVLNFERVEVVNRLKKKLAHQTIKNYTVKYDQTWIFSKIHHQINQFCSSHTLQEVLIDKFNILDESLKDALQKGCNEWAPGIEIIAVRVTKPKVSEQMKQTFIQRQAERTKLLIRKQQQKVIAKKSQIEKKISKIKAETSSKISQIQNSILLAEKQANKKIATIQNQINVLKQTAHAKAKKYRQEKLIELNKKKLTPENEIANLLNNVKNSHKNIYTNSLLSYFEESFKLISDLRNKGTKPTTGKK